jgi:tetratricopeptide (TPR) repeat protein
MSRGLIAQRRSADLQQAIQTLHEVLELKPDHAGALAALGIAYVLSPDQFYPEGVARERANGLFDEAVEIDPDSALAWAGRALLAISQDSDLEQVKVYIDRALELNPYDADVLAWAANLAGSEGRVDAAFEYLNRALAVDPLHVTVSGNLSFNLVRQGRYEQAKALLDNAEARLGDHPGLYYFKVGVALSAGELETALTQAQEAVLGWPQGQFFAGQLAHVYARLQMDEEAMFWVLYARDLAGNDEQSLGASLQAYGDLGDSQSIHELVNTLRAHPQFNDLNPGASPRWLLAQLVEGHGRLSECAEVRALFPLLFESPGGLQGRRGTMTFSTDLSHWMAWCLLRDGETERAMAWLDEVTTQFDFMKAHGLGESTDDMYFESRNRFLGGDTEGALDVLEAILDLGWLDQGALEHDPRWDGLRHEARFIAALRAVTLRTREIRETIIDEGIEQDFQDRWAAIR